ncbi:MAG: carbohydrate ABC transporter permease [Candidatus Melainabacteria bacterium]
MKPLSRQQAIVLGALLTGAVLMALPFWVMAVTALLTRQEAVQETPHLWPPGWHWENYGRLFASVPMAQYFWNSVLVAVLTTAGHVLGCAMAGYAFSRLRFRGRNALFFVFLLTLMIPPQVNIVPLFFLMKTFHWIDTYWGLIVPGLFGAFGVFLMRQWFNGLPRDLEEAACLDGCNPWQTFWWIALPLATPAMAALAIFVFIGSWNNFMWPLIVTNSDTLRTLPVGIAALKSSFTGNTDWPLMMAAATVSVIPVVLVFLAGQKQFMQSLMTSGMKE